MCDVKQREALPLNFKKKRISRHQWIESSVTHTHGQISKLVYISENSQVRLEYQIVLCIYENYILNTLIKGKNYFWFLFSSNEKNTHTKFLPKMLIVSIWNIIGNTILYLLIITKLIKKEQLVYQTNLVLFDMKIGKFVSGHFLK